MGLTSATHTREARVCVVGSNPVFARGIQTILKETPGLRMIPWCADPGREPPSRSAKVVLILDLDAAPFGGFQYLQSLRSRFPSAKILVLGNPPTTADLRRLLLLGVQGFVLYRDIEQSLGPAIKAVWAGGLWVDGQELRRLADGGVKGGNRGAESASRGFTPQQQAVVELLRLRLCNKEISARLGITEATVKFHLKNIFNKLGLHDRHLVAERHAASGQPQLLAS